jgi:hypothetical protein
MHQPRSKLTTFNGVVAAFAAIAGIAFTGWQTFGPPSAPTPINVTVAAPAPLANETVAAKADVVETTISPVSFSDALNEGKEKKYVFKNIFDGVPSTYLVIEPTDTEINVLASFDYPRVITGFVYTPPQGSNARLATSFDVMILPEGRMEPTGRPVMTFDLQTSPGSQTFTLPSSERGKSILLHVPHQLFAEFTAVGDFKIITAP